MFSRGMTTPCGRCLLTALGTHQRIRLFGGAKSIARGLFEICDGDLEGTIGPEHETFDGLALFEQLAGSGAESVLTTRFMDR
jgi:hypothetical protein